MQQAGGPLSDFCTDWASGSATTRSFANCSALLELMLHLQRSSVLTTVAGGNRKITEQIIVDLERHCVVDVLEDRNVESCAEWLRRHPEIEIISRDRCGLYAQAARQGAPQALQVADRFHLVQNLRIAIEEQMNMHGRATGRALLSDADNVSADFHLLRSRLAHRKSREAIFATIHALRDQGLSCSEIERQTGFRRRGVAKWLAFEVPPDRRRATLKLTSPWYFEEILVQRWKEGNRRSRQLFHKIKEKGYEGSYSHLERLLAGWRRAEMQEPVDPATSPQKLEPAGPSNRACYISCHCGGVVHQTRGITDR